LAIGLLKGHTHSSGIKERLAELFPEINIGWFFMMTETLA
jgi:hypothetical protein